MNAERFVVDTNVLISAALKPSAVPRAVVDTIRHANGVLLSSDETFRELEARFRLPKFDAYVGREARSVFLAHLEAVSEVARASAAGEDRVAPRSSNSKPGAVHP